VKAAAVIPRECDRASQSTSPVVESRSLQRPTPSPVRICASPGATAIAVTSDEKPLKVRSNSPPGSQICTLFSSLPVAIHAPLLGNATAALVPVPCSMAS
jgi:hypothetical protein